jgi:sulfatase maturation enzyme AslB (radical SAM superfamily)
MGETPMEAAPKTETHFCPSLCVTHDCNLSCVYCYQKHRKGERMDFETARRSIDWIFTHVPDYADAVEISFIGGEPLLEFPLIKEVTQYVCEKSELDAILATDFSDDDNFIDDDCFENCYIYPVCPVVPARITS